MLVTGALLFAALASVAASSDGGAAVSRVKAHKADVSDVVSGNGAPFAWRFEYGTTTDYGARTSDVQEIGSDKDVRVAATLSRLDPVTLYHARLTWTIDGVIEHGDDMTFTTMAEDADEPVDFAPEAEGPTLPSPEAAINIDAGGPTTLPPKLGHSAATSVTGGTVLVRLPGTTTPMILPRFARVPVGTVIDTRNGAVRLTTALAGGTTQAATFRGGIFTLRQSLGLSGLIDIVLRTPSRRSCPAMATATSGARAAALTRRPPRELGRLWGADKGGSYRTHGANSVATVRGTQWLTVERCDGTITKVSEGSVSVFDRRLGRRSLVKAGGTYLAKRP